MLGLAVGEQHEFNETEHDTSPANVTISLE